MLTGCDHKTKAWNILDDVEAIMQSRPDSALKLLNNIDKDNLGDKEEQARYALLMSMALDKNYIDTTTFDVLQPAIDYYSHHGSNDDKLRTLYYSGRIFQNQGDEESALASYLKAYELKESISDSLLMAHNLVAIGTIDLRQYKIKKFIEHNLEAANLYNGSGNEEYALKSYANALGGSVMIKDKYKSDSILSVCSRIFETRQDLTPVIQIPYISYIIEFGSQPELRHLFNQLQESDIDYQDNLDFARGYARLGEYNKAMELLSNAEANEAIVDSLKYLSVKTMILEGQGNYEQALIAYKEYSTMMERHQDYLLSDNLLFVEERYRMEIANFMKIQNRNRIIWATLCSIFALALFIGWLYYRYRLTKSKRILAEKENENLKLGQEKLQKEKEKTELERNQKALEAANLEKDKKRLEAERQQRILETENLRLEKNRLEREKEDMNELLKEQSGLTQSLRKIVKTRLAILNSLLAKEIANEESYAKPYRKWIESIRKDKEEFKNSTREAFSVSHPKFMDYLISHGLTVDEINYLCLYAIGLRGKDVGEYINLKRHYNVSSEIRKKLGIDEHETNIGLYVRRLMEELDSQ